MFKFKNYCKYENLNHRSQSFNGKYSVRKLKENGHEIVILTEKTGKPNELQWNPDQNFIEDAALKT